jgi:hypothetical protein
MKSLTVSVSIPSVINLHFEHVPSGWKMGTYQMIFSLHCETIHAHYITCERHRCDMIESF